MTITLHDIKNSKVSKLNEHLNLSEKPNSSNKQKEWLQFNLSYWANKNALTLETEYKFHPQRKWRFDWCFPAIKVAIEYEGVFSSKSRHTTLTGYSNDATKYNEAVKHGWRVLRYTALNYQQVLTDLDKIKTSEA